MKLRPYQVETVEKCRQQIREGHRRIIIEAPTGSGKTVMASDLIQRASEKGKRVLFLAHARELTHQASNKLSAFGVRHGVIMAGVRPDPYAQVQVASKDTLVSRTQRLAADHPRRMELPPADLIIPDEVHRAVAPTWLTMLKAYPDAVVIGLSATPARPSGKGTGLGDVFTAMVKAATYEELIKQGYLVPTRIFAPSRPDLEGIRVSAGDYNKLQLETRMDKPKLVGDVVDSWIDHAGGRPTVVFASGIAHSEHLAEEFNKRGLNFKHIDGDTDSASRDYILQELHHGYIDGICNCAVLCEGWDCPRVSCAVLAKPTKSIGRYRQMAGRIQRPHNEKSDALIIDHSGAVYTHGFPDDDIEWSLNPTVRMTRDIENEPVERQPIVCKECGYAYKAAKACPQCGTPAPQRKPKIIKAKPGVLGEVKRARANREVSLEERQKYWDRCIFIAIGKNGPIGMASHIYKRQFGVWPNGLLKGVPNPSQRRMDARQFYDHHVKRERVAN